jgi:hypothetical protein
MDCVNWERLARAETHILRLSILEVLSLDGGRTLSKSELAHELQEPLGKLNYHLTALVASKVIRLVHEHIVGGTIEHFYCLVDHSGSDLAEKLRPWL